MNIWIQIPFLRLLLPFLAGILTEIYSGIQYDFINGKQTIFIAGLILIHDKNRMLFQIKHNWWDRNITNLELIENEKLVAFYNLNISIKNNFFSIWK